MPTAYGSDLIVRSEQFKVLSPNQLPALPLHRPLLMIGHGTRDPQGRQCFLDFADSYQQLDLSRPVFPCFLELTGPTIQEVINHCVIAGYRDLSALPILLFAARHNKVDVTHELDLARQRHSHLRFHYGRHFGITSRILELWRSRLEVLDGPDHNPHKIPRSQTLLLVVGRGSSDPDANSDVCKLARILWEGSGYQTVETCFIGITHPRLEAGFERARLYQPQRIIVLPYFLFTGVLVQKIFAVSAQQQTRYPQVQITCLPEMGLHPHLFDVVRQRELETQLGQVQMNCELCKFRLADNGDNHDHHHDHHYGHARRHHHHALAHPNHGDSELDYHQRIWQVP